MSNTPEKDPKHRDLVREVLNNNDGCYCSALGHMAPCTFCTTLTENEVRAHEIGGLPALEEFWEGLDYLDSTPELWVILDLAGVTYFAKDHETHISIRQDGDHVIHNVRPEENIKLSCGHVLAFFHLREIIKEKKAQAKAPLN